MVFYNVVQIPLFKIKLSSLPQPQPSTLACLAYTLFPKHIHCVTAWVIQHPVLGMTSCGNIKKYETQSGIVIHFSLHSLKFNPSFQAQDYFHCLHEALPGNSSPHFHLPCSTLFQFFFRRVHTLNPISLPTTYALTLCNQGLIFTLSSKYSKVMQIQWPFPSSHPHFGA